MRRLGSKLAIAALLAVIVILFNWKLVLPGQYTWAEQPDNLNLVLPMLQMQAAQWHDGRFPLWDPYICAGMPLVGQVLPGTFNPLNWVLFSIPLKDGFLQISALHWYWVSIQFLGVLFAYLLCRDLRLSRVASVLGGCAFGLGGFVGTIGWPQLMMSAILLPVILMFFLRVLRGEKPLANAAASGTLLGASFLAGHHNVPIFFTVTMVGLWIYHFVSSGPAIWRKAMAPCAAFFACCGLIAAAQILPSYELGKLSLRWVGPVLEWNQKVPYSVHDQLSLDPNALASIVMNGPKGGPGLFIGLVILTLGLLGAVARWQDRMVRILTAISLGGLLFALGSRNLFHGILYAVVPDLDKARSPVMAEAIFQLGLIALAAYGLDAYRSAQVQERLNRLAIRLLASLSLFLGAALLLMLTVRPAHGDEYASLAQPMTVSLLLAALLLLWTRSRISHRAAGVLLVLLLLFELNQVSNSGHQPMETAHGLQILNQDRDLAGFLKQVQGPVRVMVDDKEIPYNFGDWFGIQQLRAYLPIALKHAHEPMNDPRFQSILAANYYLGREPRSPDQVSYYEGQRGIKAFRNPAALPQVRLVHEAIGVASALQVTRAVRDPKTDLQRTVILEGSAPALDNCEGGSTELQQHQPARVVLLADSPCRAMVLLADVWYPGWKAYVDGKPAQIWKAYNVVRGVVVDAGLHEVRMVYRPASVYAGAALTALGILLCIALQYFPARPPWRHGHIHHHTHPRR